MINRKNHIPLYIQLANLLREQIKSGEIAPGDKLMSESEMIKQYKIGRFTIREALSMLENEGLIEKQHGRGSFCKRGNSLDKKKINVLLDTSDLYFIPYYINSICKILEFENVDVILANTRDDVETTCQLLEQILASGADGVIIQPTHRNEKTPERLVRLFDALEEGGIPYIMVDSVYDDVTSSFVMMDEYEAGAAAARYLLECGHRNMCMLCRAGYKDSDMRLEGFKSEVDNEVYIIDVTGDILNQIKTMAQTHPEITGVYCYNDEYAREFYRAAKELGYIIPDDYSVVGTDDTIIASTLTPGLTSVAHPKDKLGKAAAQALLDIISGKKPWPYNRMFIPAIKERHSCNRI